MRVRHLETGEIYELEIIERKDARPAFPYHRDGTPITPRQFETHFCRNQFRTWSGSKENFERLFTKV